MHKNYITPTISVCAQTFGCRFLYPITKLRSLSVAERTSINVLFGISNGYVCVPRVSAMQIYEIWNYTVEVWWIFFEKKIVI